MKKYIVLIFIAGLFSLSSVAQNVLFSDNAENAYDIPRKGRNRAAFGHLYSGYRIAPSYFQDNDVSIWNGEYFAGYRAKYAITRNYAMGWDAEYLHTAVAWDVPLLIGEAVIGMIQKHRYVSHALLFSYYNRITFGKVGDNIGKFLDIGVYGAWNFGKKSMYISDLDGGKEYVEKTVKRPDYDDTFFYGVKARLGIHRIAVTADYRFVTPDFSTVPSQDINMPHLTVGLELSLYKPKM